MAERANVGCGEGFRGEGAGEVALVQEGDDLVARFEAGYALVYCLDGSCAIRAGDYMVFGAKEIFVLLGLVTILRSGAVELIFILETSRSL